MQSRVGGAYSPGDTFQRVGVGIMVAHNPLHGSGRAGFPHPALASGDNAEAAQGIRMMDARRGQPAVNNPPHAVPAHAAVLTAPRQRAMPEPDHMEPEQAECRAVHGNTVVSVVSLDHRAQPLTHLRDGVVHASLELGFHLAQLGLQPRTNRLPQHREPPITALLPADVREAEKVEGLGLCLTAPLALVDRIRAELQQAGFVRMQLQSELPESFLEFLPEPLGIRLVLESEHDVVREPDDYYVAAGMLAAPRPDPQVEGVVEIDVREQRRDYAPYTKANFQFERVMTGWRNTPILDLRLKK